MSTTPSTLSGNLEIPSTVKAYNLRLWLSLASVYIIWSSTYLGMKLLLEVMGPMTMGALRFILAGGLLYLLHRFFGGARPTSREVIRAMPVGLLLFLAGNGFIAIAQDSDVTSAVASIVASTTPIWVACLGPLFGIKTHASEWLGVALGTIGIALLGVSSELGGSPGMIILLLMGPLTWGLGSLIAKRVPQAPGLAAPALHMAWGGLGMALAAPLLGETWPVNVELKHFGIFAFLVVFGSLIGFTAYSWLLKNTRPTLAMSYSYVNPVMAVVLGHLLLDEPVYWTTIAATVFLVLAVLAVLRASLKKRHLAKIEQKAA